MPETLILAYARKVLFRPTYCAPVERLLGSCLPNSGISTTMKYRQNNAAMLFCTKINIVRETIGNNTPNVLANNSKLEGLFRC